MARKILVAGLTAGALVTAAAAGIVAVHKYRLDHPHDQDDNDGLDTLEDHLDLADGDDPEAKHIALFWRRLVDRGAASPANMRTLIHGLRERKMSDDEAAVLEGELIHIESHAARQNPESPLS